jgi:hypothetical protein
LMIDEKSPSHKSAGQCRFSGESYVNPCCRQ